MNSQPTTKYLTPDDLDEIVEDKRQHGSLRANEHRSSAQSQKMAEIESEGW